ncbi:MICOS complex subunit MIC25 isoform X2 [Choloepus didactylus]|uniref:MICOS complex subunit MIC25 isoform X2 n=1 Tax=Choloepus didactylus TaxID=27675 RepID=UPI0018A07F36|nr:MICOS complex subunit MIC25 isoform X2 [Choloepus didactylus]
MGSAESSEGRRVSFGMDEEERVRVLQGIRLSEDVVNRMKDSSQPSKAQQPAPPPRTPPPSSALGSSEGNAKAPKKELKPPRSESSRGQQPSGAAEDLLRRYEQEQAIMQDEMFQKAKREREAAIKHLKVSLQQKESITDQEKPKSAQLAKELEGMEEELRCRDSFYKEHLGRLERKTAEMYKLSSQQFHEAASKTESTIHPRRVEPVCSDLQAQILRCYRENLQEVLLCSDLVKAYQRCVSAAHQG